ncbi:MAG: glycosyltransferase family 4 protein [Mangrovibacterium sp.]
MRITYDAKRITNNLTGLGNYSRFVVNNLALQFPKDEFFLLAANACKKGLGELIYASKNLQLLLPKKKQTGIKKSIWRTWGIQHDINALHANIYHGLTNELPFSIKKTGVKSVVTIHDLIFLRYPRFYKAIDRTIYNYKFRRACKDADHIVAVSECTKRDITQFYGITPEKISVIYQGCHEQFKQNSTDEQQLLVRQKFNLPEEFILSVGTVEERKNLLLIVKALKASGLSTKLIVIGRKTKYARQVDEFIAQNQMQEQVTYLDRIDYTELPVIYQLASLFVYPSLYEGFGIPIIEALHSRVPVIAATGSCLEEAGGASSIYVNPHNETELAEKMQLVLNDGELRNKMIADGLQHVLKFEDAKLSKQMMNLYTHITS